MNRIGKEMERGGSQVVDNVLLDGKAVDGIVSLAPRSDEAAESDGVERPCVDTILIDLANVELHGGVVLGANEAGSGRALAGDVQVHLLSGFVLHGV